MSKQQYHIMMRAVVVHLVQHMSVEPDWLAPPEDGDWLRGSLAGLAQHARAHGDAELADKIEKILWEPIMYRNTYECEACGASWTDTHSCACDDECPSCGESVAPTDSVRVELSKESVT